MKFLASENLPTSLSLQALFSYRSMGGLGFPEDSVPGLQRKGSESLIWKRKPQVTAIGFENTHEVVRKWVP